MPSGWNALPFTADRSLLVTGEFCPRTSNSGSDKCGGIPYPAAFDDLNRPSMTLSYAYGTEPCRDGATRSYRSKMPDFSEIRLRLINLTVSFSHPPTACDVAADSTDTWAAS